MAAMTQPSGPGMVRRVFLGPSELRAGWRLLIFMLVLVPPLAAVNWAARRWLQGTDDAVRFLVRVVASIGLLLLVSALMGRIEGRSIADYGLPGRSMFRRRFWQGALFGFAAISLLVLAMQAAGVFRFGGLALHGGGILGWGCIYFCVFVLVGVREEFGTRGYMLFTLTTGLGFWPAAILSSALFAYGHHANPGENWIGLVNVGVYGMFAAFLLRRTGDLWLPIGFHMAFDWGETYFYGVADSGHPPRGNLLHSFSSGPVWLSGGTVGPEGSVLCTLLFIVLWLACAQWLRQTRYPAGAGRRRAW